MIFDLEAMLQAYLDTALWSSADEDGDPLDRTYDAEDLTPAFVEDSRADCEAFVRDNAADLAASGLSADQIGHNFWLTREGHGAGFWDLGLGDVGDRLTESARAYGSVDLMPGDQLPIRED